VKNFRIVFSMAIFLYLFGCSSEFRLADTKSKEEKNITKGGSDSNWRLSDSVTDADEIDGDELVNSSDGFIEPACEFEMAPCDEISAHEDFISEESPENAEEANDGILFEVLPGSPADEDGPDLGLPATGQLRFAAFEEGQNIFFDDDVELVVGHSIHLDVKASNVSSCRLSGLPVQLSDNETFIDLDATDGEIALEWYYVGRASATTITLTCNDASGSAQELDTLNVSVLVDCTKSLDLGNNCPITGNLDAVTNLIWPGDSVTLIANVINATDCELMEVVDDELVEPQWPNEIHAYGGISIVDREMELPPHYRETEYSMRCKRRVASQSWDLADQATDWVEIDRITVEVNIISVDAPPEQHDLQPIDPAYDDTVEEHEIIEEEPEPGIFDLIQGFQTKKSCLADIKEPDFFRFGFDISNYAQGYGIKFIEDLRYHSDIADSHSTRRHTGDPGWAPISIRHSVSDETITMMSEIGLVPYTFVSEGPEYIWNGSSSIRYGDESYGTYKILDLGCKKLLFRRASRPVQFNKTRRPWRLLTMYGQWVGHEGIEGEVNRKTVAQYQADVNYLLNTYRQGLHLFPGVYAIDSLMKGAYGEDSNITDGLFYGVVDLIPVLGKVQVLRGLPAVRRVGTGATWGAYALRVGQIGVDWGETGELNIVKAAETVVLALLTRHSWKAAMKAGPAAAATHLMDDVFGDLARLPADECISLLKQAGISARKAKKLQKALAEELPNIQALTNEVESVRASSTASSFDQTTSGIIDSNGTKGVGESLSDGGYKNLYEGLTDQTKTFLNSSYDDLANRLQALFDLNLTPDELATALSALELNGTSNWVLQPNLYSTDAKALLSSSELGALDNFLRNGGNLDRSPIIHSVKKSTGDAVPSCQSFHHAMPNGVRSLGGWFDNSAARRVCGSIDGTTLATNSGPVLHPETAPAVSVAAADFVHDKLATLRQMLLEIVQTANHNPTQAMKMLSKAAREFEGQIGWTLDTLNVSSISPDSSRTVTEILDGVSGNHWYIFGTPTKKGRVKTVAIFVSDPDSADRIRLLDMADSKERAVAAGLANLHLEEHGHHFQELMRIAAGRDRSAGKTTNKLYQRYLNQMRSGTPDQAWPVGRPFTRQKDLPFDMEADIMGLFMELGREHSSLTTMWGRYNSREAFKAWLEAVGEL
jgi:hypothetical protein